MNATTIEYPIIMIRDNDHNLYGIDYGLGLISKGGGSFYKKPIKYIDKHGFIFKIKSISKKSNAKIIDSIRHFQKMEQLEFNVEKDGEYNLEELKTKVLEHVKKSPKHWLSLGTSEMIEELVFEKETISDLIKMFR